MIVDPVDRKDRAEVESERFERTAGSVDLDSGANNQDQSPQRGSRVATDQVSVLLSCPSSFAMTETFLTAQMPVLPFAGAPEAQDLVD